MPNWGSRIIERRGRKITNPIKQYTIPDNQELTLRASKAEFRYRACPRCTGTVYKRPYVHYFACLVCGWEQQCYSCFGKVIMSGTDTKICTGCNTATYVNKPTIRN